MSTAEFCASLMDKTYEYEHSFGIVEPAVVCIATTLL